MFFNSSSQTDSRIESNVLFTRTREVSLSATTPPRQSISPSTTALRVLDEFLDEIDVLCMGVDGDIFVVVELREGGVEQRLGQLAASVAVEPLDGRLDIVVDVFEDVSTGAEPLLFGLEFGRGERLLALLIDLAIDLGGEPLFADALGIGLRLSDDLVRLGLRRLADILCARGLRLERPQRQCPNSLV